jgi:hypothetical protein
MGIVCCHENILTELLTNNGLVCCCGNMCLASRWLAMDFCSGSAIPAFMRHVTIYSRTNRIYKAGQLPRGGEFILGWSPLRFVLYKIGLEYRFVFKFLQYSPAIKYSTTAHLSSSPEACGSTGQAEKYHSILCHILNFVGKQEHFQQFSLLWYNALYSVGS